MPEPPKGRRSEGGRGGETLLAIEGLSVAYGRAEVVHDVALTVRRGEFVALFGRNGAGKSTILHALSGLIPKRAGRVWLEGKDVTEFSPRAILRAGIVQVLEGHRVFTGLSVEDNLLIGAARGAFRADRRGLARIYALFPELAERRHQPAARLSGGQQQILAVGQGLIGAPRLLILDEPSSGLAPLVVDRILAVARELCGGEMAVLLVEQLVEKALARADYCYLVETGRNAGEGTPAALRERDMLGRVYLGGAAALEEGNEDAH